MGLGLHYHVLDRKVDVILVTELTRWGRSARFAGDLSVAVDDALTRENITIA